MLKHFYLELRVLKEPIYQVFQREGTDTNDFIMKTSACLDFSTKQCVFAHEITVAKNLVTSF